MPSSLSFFLRSLHPERVIAAMDIVQKLIDTVPQLREALTTRVLQALDAKPDTPFENDEQYMYHVCSMLAVREYSRTSRELMRTAAVEPRAKDEVRRYPLFLLPAPACPPSHVLLLW